MRNSLFKDPLLSLQSPSNARVIKIKVNKNSGECIERYPPALAVARKIQHFAVYRLSENFIKILTFQKLDNPIGISDQGLRHSVLACTQTLFYFSFRSFRKHRRGCERGERARTSAENRESVNTLFRLGALQSTLSQMDIFGTGIMCPF